MAKKDLGDVWTAAKNALSKFNNYTDQGGKDAKVVAAQKALQKSADEAAVIVDKQREVLIAAMEGK